MSTKTTESQFYSIVTAIIIIIIRLVYSILSYFNLINENENEKYT